MWPCVILWSHDFFVADCCHRCCPAISSATTVIGTATGASAAPWPLLLPLMWPLFPLLLLNRHCQVQERLKGGSYMSLFWNHILANQANLSTCVLKSCGMSAVYTWGLRGIFFLLVLFVLFSHGAVCCYVAVIFPTYVLYKLSCSNFLGNDPRAYFWPSAITPPGGVSFFTRLQLHASFNHTP